VRRSVRRGIVWTVSLIVLWSMSCTPVYAEPSTTECNECETLLSEAESALTELLAENDLLRSELETCWTESALIVRETAERAAAEAARPLLVRVAGLEAENTALRRRVLSWALGGLLTGLVAGVVIGGLL